MLTFIALLTALVSLGLGVVLPLLSWARTARLEREIARLNARLAAMEASAAFAPSPRAAAHTPSGRPADETLAHETVASPVDGAAERARPSIAVPPPPLSPEALDVPAAARAAEPTAPPRAHEPAIPAPRTPPVSEPAAQAAYVKAEIRSRDHGSLEEAIGARLMLWVGTIVLVLGVAFFLKYAFENEWITESMRVVMGLAAGLGLVFAGQRFADRGYAAYGQIVTGGGIAVLFLAIYAAYNFYALIGQTTAFLLMVLVTAGAAALADRQRALGLALMAVGGGFATPFLVGSGTDAQVTLFTYDALLIMGTLYLANRQDWPVLNVLSFAFTCLTVAGWAETFYTPDKWLRTHLFLTLFCILFVLILRAQVRRQGWNGVSVAVLMAAPVLYHAASMAILAPHGVALWVYLIAVTMVGVGLGVHLDSTTVRVVTWVAVGPALLAWISDHATSRSLVPNLVSATAVFALHAIAQVDVVFRQQRRLGGADLFLLHANGYALIGNTYAALENVRLAVAPLAMVGIGLVHGALASRFRAADGRAALHALAVAIGALTVALAIELDGPWLTIALAVEGALVLLLGLLRAGRGFRLGGAALLAAAVVRYGLLSLTEVPATFSFFGNEAFIVGLTLAAILYAVAWRYRREEADAESPWSGTTSAVVTASVLVVAACSAQNEIYWTLEGDYSSDARFASSLSLSAIWMLLACAFIGVGLLRDFAPLRYLAMALFGLTVLKVFLVDLSSLGGIYRILGFIGVGAVLLAVSFFYQRGRRTGRSVSP